MASTADKEFNVAISDSQENILIKQHFVLANTDGFIARNRYFITRTMDSDCW